MFVFVLGAFAQTYYYQYVESVDENGVRSKKDVKGVYITITKNSCYVSDEKGIKSTQEPSYSSNLGKDNYAYKGEQNNLLVFSYQYWGGSSVRIVNGSWVFGEPQGDYYIYFSKDYKRINVRSYSVQYGWSVTNVFQQAASPSSAPGTFY